MAKRFIQCAFCPDEASSFYVLLNGDLWAACEKHAPPFRGTSIELDPEEYNIDACFEDWEPESEPPV